MGRKKSYEREDVTRKAMRLFWRQGFHATSTQELVEAMGINRFSLFAEFESKQGLYEAALDLYAREVFGKHFARLREANAGLDDVIAVLSFFAEVVDDPISEWGCLLTNAATERGLEDAASREAARRYVERISDEVARALENAVAAGVLRADAPVSDAADLVCATLLGVFALKRAPGLGRTQRGAIRAALTFLDGLRARG